MCSIFWDDLLMQGRSRPDRELLDAEMIAGHLVPPGSVFAFLAQHRGELFPDSFTADLFPSATGRPSLPADLVGSVLVLKELYDLSDPQTADALKFDIRWKVACGRSLTQVSFDPSTLVYWRKRIAASDRPDRVFDAVAQVIAETGILRGRRRRCVDSTVFDDAVATMDTVSQLVAAMRKVARVVPGAGEVIARVCRLDYSKPGKPDIDWDDPQARQDLVSDLVNDALAVLAELAGPASPGRGDGAADGLGPLGRGAGQDREPAEAPQRAAGREEQGLEVYGDSAYGSGQARADYREAGHDTVIKPGPLRPAVPGGFTLDDFIIDEEQGTVTCPAGHTRLMSGKRTVTFGQLCAGCPLRTRCTTAKDGRSVTIHPHEGLLRAARAQARTDEFTRDYPTRSMIERVIAWTATQNGRRIRLRYIGAAKNDAWLHNRCGAINLRTLVKAGLARDGGAWVLA